MEIVGTREVLSPLKGLIFPEAYHNLLNPLQTENSFHAIKEFIEGRLENDLNLHRVSAPLFVRQNTGINDDLNGIERAVSFPMKSMDDNRAEVVQSLAKWKRMALAEYRIPAGEGIFTNMHAIRPDETTDNLHSLFVDQWDWEKHIQASDRKLSFLKQTVERLYRILKDAEDFVNRIHPEILPVLPEKIQFVESESLLQLYPHHTPQEREFEIVKKYKAVFIIGIGNKLSDGKPHDGRAPDYDDWSTKNDDGFFGLNGDILVWNPVLKRAVELSSMGIRVNKESLVRQLRIRGQEKRLELLFHKRMMNDELPLTMGGGIGQSRVAMFLLRKAHIGEISAGLWPEEMVHLCKSYGIQLL
ncbi:MAG: aspartate--ammonia ligase [Chitinophagaceae bacterium]|nr:aspartate--ammonia ligase [Chitinophagaceae bacterium]